MYCLYFSDLINHKIILCLQIKKKTVNQFAFVGENLAKLVKKPLVSRWGIDGGLSVRSVRRVLCRLGLLGGCYIIIRIS
jgi:hypothetical protein